MQRMQLARLVHGLALLLFRARGIDVQKEGGSLAKEMSRIEQLGKKVRPQWPGQGRAGPRRTVRV